MNPKDNAQIVPFNYEGAELRTVMIDGEAWFVAPDACRMLALRDTSSALKMVDADDKQTLRRSDTPHFFTGIAPQVQMLTIVNESGMWALIFQSNKDQARKIRRWITGTVLPQIRKTGRYDVDDRTRAELVSRADLARMVLDAEEEKKVLEAALESAAPVLAYHDRHVAETGDVVTVKTWGAQYGLTQAQAYQLLVDKNIVYRQPIGERWCGRRQKVVTEHEYRARAGRATFGWFEPRPQHNAPRHHNGQVRQTLYIRQFFAVELAKKVGLSLQRELPGGAA